MFPSAGLFADTDCLLLIWGKCERPYCPYNHTKDDAGHGSHSTTSGSLDNQEPSQTCLLELERINQQIEAVKSEVEKEQKRLSRYQAESAGASSEEYLKSSSTLSKDQNGNQLNCKKPTAAALKYVVDRTKPKTDLEYDPCSNFSAALRSGNLTDKVKSAIKTDIESETGPSVAADLVQLSSCNSEDSDDERMLVIDIPPIENNRNKSGRSQKQGIAASENATQKHRSVEVCQLESPATMYFPACEKQAQHGGNVAEDIYTCLDHLRRENQPSSAELVEADNEVIQINSSSSDELNYSDLDISDSDPMEECYRIFMEEKNADPGGTPDEVSISPEPELAKPPPAQKKRVAHVAKFEQASRSTAQVIVPLRDGGSQLPVPSQTQQCQKRATTLSTAVKGCQPFIAATATKRVITPNVIHSTAVPNGCVNIIPAGATLQLGPNLHLIVPEGGCALPVTIIPATAAVAIPTKRKAKARPEACTKVPHDVRQRYVNLFVEEFLKTSATVQEAFEKALAEEKTVFDRSINKLKYLSIAVNALKRLKNQNAAPAKFSCERDVRASRGNVPLSTQALLGQGDAALYDQLTEHLLTKALLRDNNYPHKHPSKAGFAIQYSDTKKSIADGSRRICCRCGTSFSVSQTGKHTRKEECNYHYGKVIENRVPGGVETRYSCCENAVGSPGCQTFKLHVHDAVSLQGFISSLPQTHPGCPGIYAIDTEMCYTTQGLELVRVTMVNSSLQVIYDMFVKPNNEVIDYNTRFSGISEDDVKNSSSSLQDVQAVLLSFISEGTILVGHCLETDLCAIKLIHSAVVDTSVVFPHRLGPPHKRDLRSLTAEYLRKIIQEDVERHDTREDATACMELMLWKVKEDAKGKRW
ncbi:RNA exonuclease 1 homolog [Trichomycterus rosablanca]|uniref:RNA exonuclease 1 homolog n=1 Tax=Trichomycterus rosablanca TaxID=2290929 RepID=UPI002F350FB6